MGHYSGAFAARRLAPEVSLGFLVLAATWVDLLWAVLALAGIERFHLDFSLPSNPLVSEFMGYTHSLLATLLWSAAWFAFGLRRYRHARAGLALALASLSHWLLDFLVHRPDLTLFGTPPMLGLGLWNHPWLELPLELGLIVMSALFAFGGVLTRALRRFVVALLLVQLWQSLAPAPPWPPVVAAALLITFALLAWVAFRVDPERARAS